MNLKSIIKEKAPEGATWFTYEPDLSVLSFWRFNDGVLEAWSEEDGWLSHANSAESFVKFIISEMKPL